MAIPQPVFPYIKPDISPEKSFRMGKKGKIRIISFSAAILTCLFFFGLHYTGAVDIQPNVSVSGLISPEPPSYILGEYQGKLAVYRRDESEPFMVFQVYLHNLPEQDQEILAQGLEVRDYRELDRLIEDYTS